MSDAQIAFVIGAITGIVIGSIGTLLFLFEVVFTSG